MKIKGRCRGCDSIKLINALDLCKRCNRTSTEFISHNEMDERRAELEMLAQSVAAKKVKDIADKEEEKAEEEGKEGEETEEGPADDEKTKDKDKK